MGFPAWVSLFLQFLAGRVSVFDCNREELEAMFPLFFFPPFHLRPSSRSEGVRDGCLIWFFTSLPCQASMCSVEECEAMIQLWFFIPISVVFSTTHCRTHYQRSDATGVKDISRASDVFTRAKVLFHHTAERATSCREQESGGRPVQCPSTGTTLCSVAV